MLQLRDGKSPSIKNPSLLNTVKGKGRFNLDLEHSLQTQTLVSVAATSRPSLNTTFYSERKMDIEHHYWWMSPPLVTKKRRSRPLSNRRTRVFQGVFRLPLCQRDLFHTCSDLETVEHFTRGLLSVEQNEYQEFKLRIRTGQGTSVCLYLTASFHLPDLVFFKSVPGSPLLLDGQMIFENRLRENQTRVAVLFHYEARDMTHFFEVLLRRLAHGMQLERDEQLEKRLADLAQRPPGKLHQRAS